MIKDSLNETYKNLDPVLLLKTIRTIAKRTILTCLVEQYHSENSGAK